MFTPAGNSGAASKTNVKLQQSFSQEEKKGGGYKNPEKTNGEALFKREKKDGTAAGASQMRFSLFYWLVYSIRRERQHIDTPVVCSAAHGATQTNPARSKHSYSSMRPVSLCVCVRTREAV